MGLLIFVGVTGKKSNQLYEDFKLLYRLRGHFNGI